MGIRDADSAPMTGIAPNSATVRLELVQRADPVFIE
jgi:hypothetical protein